MNWRAKNLQMALKSKHQLNKEKANYWFAFSLFWVAKEIVVGYNVRELFRDYTHEIRNKFTVNKEDTCYART